MSEQPSRAALLLTSVFVVSGSVLLYVVNRLWDKNGVVTS